MNALQEELPNLIVTLAAFVLIGGLLGFKIVPPGDTLVTGTVPVMISYWFLRGAFKYTPAQPASPATREPSVPAIPVSEKTP